MAIKQGLLEQEVGRGRMPLPPTWQPPGGQPAVPPTSPPGGQPDAAWGQGKNTDAADMFIANGLRLIHDRKISDNFIKKIVNSDDPVEAIADATLMVVDKVEQEATKSGVKLPDGNLAQIGNIFMGEIITIAESSGMDKLSNEDKYRAYSIAVSKHIDTSVKSGKITPDQLQKMSQQAEQSPEGQKMKALMEQMGGGQAQAGGQPAGGQPPSPTPGMPPGGRM